MTEHEVFQKPQDIEEQDKMRRDLRSEGWQIDAETGGGTGGSFYCSRPKDDAKPT